MYSRTVVSEEYKNYEKLVYHTVHRFVKKYGGDSEEYIAEANVVFLNAFEKFDRTAGYRFSTYLVRSIWNRLLNVAKREMDHNRRYNTSLDSGPDGLASRASLVPDSGDSGWAFEDLGHNARTVLDLVLRAPAEIRASLSFTDGLSISETAKEWKKAIRGYFKHRGLDMRVVDRAFDEIREAMAAA